MDVVRVSREAYAEAFRRVTGRPAGGAAAAGRPQRLGDLLRVAGAQRRALGPASGGAPAGQELLAKYTWELAEAFGARRELLTQQGRLLPGAADAVRATAALPGVLQSVLTGTIRPNAAAEAGRLRPVGLLRPGHRRLRRRRLPQGLPAAELPDPGRGEVPRPASGGRDRVPGRLRPGRRGGPDRGRAAASPWPAAGPRSATCGPPAPTSCWPTCPTRPQVVAAVDRLTQCGRA